MITVKNGSALDFLVSYVNAKNLNVFGSRGNVEVVANCAGNGQVVHYLSEICSDIIRGSLGIKCYIIGEIERVEICCISAAKDKSPRICDIAADLVPAVGNTTHALVFGSELGYGGEVSVDVNGLDLITLFVIPGNLNVICKTVEGVVRAFNIDSIAYSLIADISICKRGVGKNVRLGAEVCSGTKNNVVLVEAFNCCQGCGIVLTTNNRFRATKRLSRSVASIALSVAIIVNKALIALCTDEIAALTFFTFVKGKLAFGTFKRIVTLSVVILIIEVRACASGPWEIELAVYFGIVSRIAAVKRGSDATDNVTVIEVDVRELVCIAYNVLGSGGTNNVTSVKCHSSIDFLKYFLGSNGLAIITIKLFVGGCANNIVNIYVDGCVINGCSEVCLTRDKSAGVHITCAGKDVGTAVNSNSVFVTPRVDERTSHGVYTVKDNVCVISHNTYKCIGGGAGVSVCIQVVLVRNCNHVTVFEGYGIGGLDAKSTVLCAHLNCQGLAAKIDGESLIYDDIGSLIVCGYIFLVFGKVTVGCDLYIFEKSDGRAFSDGCYEQLKIVAVIDNSVASLRNKVVVCVLDGSTNEYDGVRCAEISGSKDSELVGLFAEFALLILKEATGRRSIGVRLSNLVNNYCLNVSANGRNEIGGAGEAPTASRIKGDVACGHCSGCYSVLVISSILIPVVKCGGEFTNDITVGKGNERLIVSICKE